MDLTAVYDSNVLLAFEKSQKLDAATNATDWTLSIDDSEISFENGLVFPVQCIATRSDHSGTWLWADANHQMNFPASSLEVVKMVRESGSSKGIAGFATDQINIGTDGFFNAKLVVAADFLGRVDASFSCPHDDGELHIAICDARIGEQPDLNLEQLRSIIGALIWLEGDLFERVVSYLLQKQLINKHPTGDEVECLLASGETFKFSVQKEGESLSYRF